jgi:hypothetical protein
MSAEFLNCNACGALIPVPSTARYAACNRCGEHLVVHRTEAASYTEIAPRHERGRDPDDVRWREVEQRLDDLARDNALMRLDRDWERKRERFMMYGRYGRRQMPNVASAVVCLVIGGGIGVAAAAVALFSLINNQPGGLFCLLPASIPAAILIFTGFYQFTRAKQYQAAQEDYRRRREAMLRGDDDPGWRRDDDPPLFRQPANDDD